MKGNRALLLILSLTLLAGCVGGEEKAPQPTQPPETEPSLPPTPPVTEEPGTPPPEPSVEAVVGVEWLEAKLGDPGIKVVYVGDSRQAYSQAHIENSVFLDQRKLYKGGFNPNEPGFVVSKEEFEELMGELGITPETHVVIYGNPKNPFVARAFWVLKYYGHEKVSYLDGGIDAWVAKGFTLSSAPVQVSAATYQVQEPRKEVRVEAEYILSKLNDPGVVIVDTRSSGEYAAGRIPGAVHLNWVRNLKGDGTFKDLEELAKMYEEAGVTKDKEVIVYCKTGTRSSNTFLVLKELLQYPNVKNYDASWNEWGVKYEGTDKIEK